MDSQEGQYNAAEVCGLDLAGFKAKVDEMDLEHLMTLLNENEKDLGGLKMDHLILRISLATASTAELLSQAAQIMAKKAQERGAVRTRQSNDPNSD